MDLILTKPSGVQKNKHDVVPLPFSFHRHVLSGGALDQHLLKAVINLTIAETFPKTGGHQLVDWDDLYPNQLLTYASAYHRLNKSINANAISKGRVLLTISDDDISKHISLVGMASPNEIESGEFLRGMSGGIPENVSKPVI